MEDQTRDHRSRALFWISIVLAGIAFLGALFVRRRRRERAGRRLTRLRPPVPQAVLDLQGLTEEEAAARLIEGQDNAGGSGGAVQFKPPYSKRQIWRGNTLTIFNLSMVGLAVVQILLGKPFDALLTTGVMFLGIGLNAGQQLWARGRLKALEQTTRAQATVVREGTVRSIDPGEVVQGDVLVVGPGDQMLADGQVLGTGQLVVDESMLTGDPRQHTRQAGEPVYAGSFCLAGHGAYEAQKVGSERLIAALTGEFQAVEEELTPLERTMDRLLRILLIIVAVLSLLLLADYFDLLLPGIHMDAFASAASVIFGIAPSSLFLMILVNYAMGTADLARVGALVHRSRSVESLAQATVICFAQAGILTGMDLEMEPVEASKLAASRIRQILGDYARSTSVSSPAVRAIAAAFPGNQRRAREEAPFLSLYGWSAVAFDDEDLRGVYVLGDPDLLGEHLVSDEPQPEDAGEERPAPVAWRERIEGLWRAVRPSTETTPGESSAQQDEQEQLSPSAAPQEAMAAGNPVQRLSRQVARVLRREEGAPESGEQELQPIEEAVYMMAYCPEPVPLHTADGMPTLPEGLLPLCRLRYTEQVRPEAVETVRAFSQSGVEMKVFTQDAPERTLAVLRQAGLGRDDGTPLRAVSEPELAALDRVRFERAAVENTIFGTMSPEPGGPGGRCPARPGRVGRRGGRRGERPASHAAGQSGHHPAEQQPGGVERGRHCPARGLVPGAAAGSGQRTAYRQWPARHSKALPEPDRVPDLADPGHLGRWPRIPLPVETGFAHHHRFGDTSLAGAIPVGAGRRGTPGASRPAAGTIYGSGSRDDGGGGGGGVHHLSGDVRRSGVRSACRHLHTGDLGPGVGCPSPSAGEGSHSGGHGRRRAERRLAPHSDGPGAADPRLCRCRDPAGGQSLWSQAAAAAHRLPCRRLGGFGLGIDREPDLAGLSPVDTLAWS